MRDELVFGWKNIGGIRLAARDWPDVRAPHGRERFEQTIPIFQLSTRIATYMCILTGRGIPYIKAKLASIEIFVGQAHLYLDANPPIGLIVLISKGAANNPSFWIVSPNAIK
jgi:hypothetical protein